MRAAQSGAAVDYADIQGLLRFGHGQASRACSYVLRIRDADAARAWLRSTAVTDAVRLEQRPTHAVQVGLTARGMTALGVPDRIVRSFSPELVSGMTGDDSRSRRLGDVDASAPSRWRWGAGDRVPDVLVMLFATPDAWSTWEQTVTGHPWTQAYEVIARLPATDLDGTEPFGFADGISQPELDWAQSRASRTEEPAYTNLASLGEFVLGYRNEYGRFTDRPLVDAGPAVDLPVALDAPDKADLGRNGTYLVFRDLLQDGRRFWQYLHANAASSIAAQRLAEAIVGRTMIGDPLVPSQRSPIPGVSRTPDEMRLNQFTFEGDPHGDQCPLGAHVRRANPRTGDFAGPVRGPISRLVHRFGFAVNGIADDRVASTRFHRVLRRGRKYGPTMTIGEALAPPPDSDPERGLYFVALNANIARQFEFIQNAWIMSDTFEGLSCESDPLMGNRSGRTEAHPCDTFTIPQPGTAGGRLYGLPQFVTVRAGGYFFLPGVRALRYLATVATQ